MSSFDHRAEALAYLEHGEHAVLAQNGRREVAQQSAGMRFSRQREANDTLKDLMS